MQLDVTTLGRANKTYHNPLVQYGCNDTHAGYNPSIELLGVSSVAGNQTCDKTTQNALKVLAAAGLGHVGMVLQSPSLCLVRFADHTTQTQIM